MKAKWDVRFLQMARLVASWSKDPSTKTGAVFVRDKVVLSVGFNGFPQSMSDDEALYANREEKYSRIVHCEVNASIFAERPLRGSTLYTWPFASCDRCAVQMLQLGAQRFVFPEPTPEQKTRWAGAWERTERYFREAGVEWTEYPLGEIP